MNREKSLGRQSAFTLVELLVVIAVVGLLGSIIFAITRGAGEQGRIATGLYFSQHLHNSLGSYAAGIWSFDEGTGSTANDTSGWENNGTLINSPTWRCASTDISYTPSGQGCSLEFNGSSNYVDAGSGASLNIAGDITIEFWANRNGVSSYAVLTKGIDADNSYAIRYQASTKTYFTVFKFGGTNYQKSFPDNTQSDYGVWEHLAFTRTGGTVKVYYNGVSYPSINYGGWAMSTAADLEIGRDNNTYFNGKLDEVRIYATSLTSAQIQSQYYAGLERLLAKNLIDEQEYQQRLAINKQVKT
jgi:prepilin-type N-terminal cleavage/methylation domain-containing protein